MFLLVERYYSLKELAKNKKTKLLCVPGRSGIYGNEQAGEFVNCNTGELMMRQQVAVFIAK